jgi:hypothetical protein
MKRTWTTNDGQTFGTYVEAKAHEALPRSTRLDTKPKLIERLKALAEETDRETAHCRADDALLEYINSKEVHEAFDAIEKWYA